MAPCLLSTRQRSATMLRLFFVACACLAAKAASSTHFCVTSLTTEYLESPLGVDTPYPRVSWRVSLANTLSPRRGVSQKAYRIQVSNTIDFSGAFWDCGQVQSTDSTLVPLSDQCSRWRIQSDTHYFWRVTVTLDDNSTATGYSSFHTGLLLKSDWRAKWITGGDVKTLLRSEFDAPKVTSHATLFVTGIGYHEIFLNGAKVGDHWLDPGWTDYSKRIWYATHDLSNSLIEGTNVIGAMLGNGWWSCGVPPGSGNPNCEDLPPQLLLQLHVNGKVVTMTSADPGQDITWRVAAGPIILNSLYNGEVFDARIAEALEGWTSSGFDDSNWTPASPAVSSASRATLSSQVFEPIRHISTRGPIRVTSPASGVQVFDFGQNQAGVVRLKRVFCDRDANVTLRHAELLTHPPYGPRDGGIYVENLRTARAKDVYICRGDVEGESYTPTFTQHGFRYVEVTGLAYPLNEEDIEAVELHSDVRKTSSLLFSHPLLNEIQRAVVWGQKTNLMSVPTDCDQRDERRGWMGDASLTAEEAAYNFRFGAFYTHFLRQIGDSQNSDGSVPNTVPAMGSVHGSPNWQSAFPMIIWVLYTYYGDNDVVSRNHDALVRYYSYFESNYNKSGIKNFMTGFGDWVPPPPNPQADGHLTGAFAFLHDLQLGTDLFASSSHPDGPSQSRRCARLRYRLSTEYHEAFYSTTTGMYMSGLQTEQALPLFLDVVPAPTRETVLSRLVEDILVTNIGHTTCGIIGIKFLMETLSLSGYPDVALDLALQTTYPSWGFMLHNDYEPATTLWELWNSDKAPPNMNSRNHIMFGSVSSWFYKYVAGITPIEPGYSRVAIKPAVTGHPNLTHVDARVVTPSGDIYSAWKRENQNGSIIYTHVLLLPPGITGLLTFPVAFGAQSASARSPSITESGHPVWSNEKFISGVPGVVSGKKTGAAIDFHLTNGQFAFVTSVPLNQELPVDGPYYID